MEINSPMNEKVKNWAKLQQKKYRDQTGQFLIEGEHLIGEALKAGVVEQMCIRDSLVMLHLFPPRFYRRSRGAGESV